MPYVNGDWSVSSWWILLIFNWSAVKTRCICVRRFSFIRHLLSNLTLFYSWNDTGTLWIVVFRKHGIYRNFLQTCAWSPHIMHCRYFKSQNMVHLCFRGLFIFFFSGYVPFFKFVFAQWTQCFTTPFLLLFFFFFIATDFLKTIFHHKWSAYIKFSVSNLAYVW